jgi:hypothetical protein
MKYAGMCHWLDAYSRQDLIYITTRFSSSFMRNHQSAHGNPYTLYRSKGMHMLTDWRIKVHQVLYHLILKILYTIYYPWYHIALNHMVVQEREDPSLTEWDRFAHTEYIRLSMEEDGEDASNSSAEVWDESFEAPF